MRTVQLAREHGLSTQAVRNHEAAGVLPAAARTAAGYRVYDERHAASLRAYLALVGGHGYPAAREVLRRVHAGDVDGALARLDAAHAALDAERAVVETVAGLLHRLGGPAPVTRRGSEPISAVAHRLRLRPATLRRWERSGLLRPGRDPSTGHRRYGPDDVRDAHVVHQLRRGGLPLAAIAPVMDELRGGGDPSAAAAALDARRAALARRSRSALAGAAHLHALLELVGA
ncbi:MerR family transcriptional regulator [Pseudonocardia broussonetiae]|uniref:MerR family transcriptional regulator n=1 Tax=Pseudonocardia broussonetiae TaxID=2736640 RepID=A0A6M6JFA2_9PSEU|nr:MerR family transcriptional regulator [Pseudonocardia broussonetiae]QJY45161.1 MerR family transcriptional regulator [Pseudonocardia broussonetiae]